MKKTMKVKMVTGTYTLYRKQANGSLKRIGDVAYERPAEPVGDDPRASRAARWAFLAARDAADCARQAEMCDWFEDLADRANAEG